MSAVPQDLRDGAYGLGSTRLQVSTRIVVPAAISGIVASYVLAISRAIGETMIVLIAAGGLAQITVRPARAGPDDDRVHRRDRDRRRSDRLDRVQDDLRGRAHALRDHVRDEHRSPSASCGSSGRSTNERPAVPQTIGRQSRGDKVRGTPSTSCCSSRVSIGFVLLGVLLFDVVRKGIGYIDPRPLHGSRRSANPEKAGARPAILGTIYMMVLLLVFDGHPARRRHGDLPRGVREPRALVQPAARDEHPEPRRRARRSSTGSSGSPSSCAGSASAGCSSRAR